MEATGQRPRSGALYMIDRCGTLEEVRRVVGEIIDKPWKWRAEFVIARCLELDGK